MIHVEGLTKAYSRVRALDNFNLHVDRGELFGLVGPNGAGKTTLMTILATLNRPDAGRAAIADHDVTVDRSEVRRLLGYMPDSPGVYQDMEIREFLEFFAEAFRLHGAEKDQAVELALQRSQLAGRAGDLVEQLSLGWKQRLLLEKTLLHGPQVLILDEPATGLDPVARIELREHLRALNAAGVTILISSHILSDLEDICTKVALIRDGKNATDADGNSVIELKKVADVRIYEVDVASDTAAAAEIARRIPGVSVVSIDAKRLRLRVEGGDAEAAQLLRELVIAGVAVSRFDSPVLGLEQKYKQAFKGRPQ